jgi:hypothetical protein
MRWPAPLEEDRGQRHHPDFPRDIGVVKLDPAKAIGAEQHPQSEEGDERRDSRARGAEGDDDARRQDATDDQQEKARVHPPVSSGIRAMRPRLGRYRRTSSVRSFPAASRSPARSSASADSASCVVSSETAFPSVTYLASQRSAASEAREGRTLAARSVCRYRPAMPHYEVLSTTSHGGRFGQTSATPSVTRAWSGP